MQNAIAFYFLLNWFPKRCQGKCLPLFFDIFKIDIKPFSADPCYYHQSLNDASRKNSYLTPQYREVCDDQLREGWYRFVGAAGTKMPTTRVPAYRCGTDWSGWLDGAHPTLEDGEVPRTVCFSDRSTGCKYSTYISVRNCGSYFIYKLRRPLGCPSRYCGTDWMWSKYTWRSKRTHKSNRRYMCIRFLTFDVVNLSSPS